MAKPKIRFVCQSCGYVTAKWLGKCPECGQWDSFVEEMDVPERPGQSYLPVGETAKPKPLHQVAEQSSAVCRQVSVNLIVCLGRDCSRQPGFVGRRPGHWQVDYAFGCRHEV